MNKYVGFDVSKEATTFCVIDEAGATVARGQVASTPQALAAALGRFAPQARRVVLETGTMAHWLARGLAHHSVTAEIVDAREAHAIMKLRPNKSDVGDAHLLAQIARAGLCRPVAIKSETAQHIQIVLKARHHLVQSRRALANTMRGLLRSMGIVLAAGAARLARRVHTALADHPSLRLAILPLLDALDGLEKQIARLDAIVAAQAGKEPAARLLMSAPGVGPVIALAYLAVIDDPNRFVRSRAVGPYLGLTARRYQSGDTDYNGRISKHGNTMLRSLAYEAASCLMTRVRRAHPLKDWARRIKKRSGHKKACVALARKLMIVLHAMLRANQPFRWPEPKPAAN